MGVETILVIAFLAFLHMMVPLFCIKVLKWNITLKELGIQFGIGIFATLLLSIFTMNLDARDVEVLNGRVVDKSREKVSCSHSYDCYCTTRTRSDGTSYRSCRTCYRHSYDFDWTVDTTVGKIWIEREDSQGKKEPKRWTAVNKDEPAARMNSYKNWVKAAPSSIFSLRETYGDQYKEVPYPRVHDYYRINRVINHSGYPVKGMNDELNRWLRRAGYNKQVNVIVILTKETSRDYSEFIRQTWLGGKKNDVVVVVNPGNGNIQWVRVFSWSKNTAVHTFIEETTHMDDLSNNIIKGVNKYYVRRPMEEFEYLKDEVRPPLWATLLSLAVNILLSIGLSVYMHRNYVA